MQYKHELQLYVIKKTNGDMAVVCDGGHLALTKYWFGMFASKEKFKIENIYRGNKRKGGLG